MPCSGSHLLWSWELGAMQSRDVQRCVSEADWNCLRRAFGTPGNALLRKLRRAHEVHFALHTSVVLAGFLFQPRAQLAAPNFIPQVRKISNFRNFPGIMLLLPVNDFDQELCRAAINHWQPKNENDSESRKLRCAPADCTSRPECPMCSCETTRKPQKPSANKLQSANVI